MKVVHGRGGRSLPRLRMLRNFKTKSIRDDDTTAPSEITGKLISFNLTRTNDGIIYCLLRTEYP